MAVNEVRIQVDRKTFYRWGSQLRALRIAHTVPITVLPLSSSAGTTPFPSVQTPIRFRGLTFLSDIGRACSRPESMDDPARFFAILRYASAIDRFSRELRLDDSIGDMDPHKKKVLSDEFGCGMAFLVSRKVFGARLWLDFDSVATRDWVITAAPRSRRPDYLAIIRRNPSNSSDVMLLEAKGTQTSVSYCRSRQIPSGCAQLSKPIFQWYRPVNLLWRVVTGVALSYSASDRRTEIFVGDPEAGGPDAYEFTQPEQDVIVKSHYLRLAALTGDASLAFCLDQGGERSALDSPMQSMKLDGSDFKGSSLILQHESSMVRLFYGLRQETREELAAGRYDTLLTRIMSSDHPPLEGDADGDVIASVDADDLAVDMRFEGPEIARLDSDEEPEE